MQRNFRMSTGDLTKCDALRRIKVISQDEWQRLNSQLRKESEEQAEIEEKRKAIEAMKKQSADMVKNWTNTFLGARQKKLEEREKRLAQEEEAKVAIDIEEAKFQAEKRREAIEDAKLKIYYQTDRVKNFHSALNLTEVLKEREKQLEFKDWCRRISADKDKAYVEKMRIDFEEAKRKEQEAMVERRNKNVQMAEQLKQQMKLNEEAKIKQEKEKVEERKRMLELNAEYEKESRMYQEKEREEAKQLMEDYKQQMKGNDQMRLIERLKEQEEEDKCRVFAAAKRKMTTLRILKEREIFETREKDMERIRQHLAEKIKMQVDDETDRIARAQAEKDEADRLREAEKAKRQAEKIAEIEAHRLETIRRHRMEAEEARQAEIEEAKKINEANRAFTEYENACLEKQLQKAKALSAEYMQQTKQKEEERKHNREIEIKMVGDANTLVQQEEMLFQEYAKQVIDHCEKGRRNIYPIVKASQKGGSGTREALVNQSNHAETNDNHRLESIEQITTLPSKE